MLVVSGKISVPQRFGVLSTRRQPLHIARSRLQKQTTRRHHRHDKGGNKKEGDAAVEVEPSPATDQQEEYEKTHPHGIAKVILDIKTALYSWLGTGIEPL